MAKTLEEVNKWLKHSGTPRNGSSIEGSQSMAELSGTARKGQEMTEVPRKVRKWQQCPEKARNCRDVRQEVAEKSLQREETIWRMLFARFGGAVPTSLPRSGVHSPGLGLWRAIPGLGTAKKC
ncbi:hypothetical protein Taro_026879 [Colocasia esculenta]|uniref:Uncharacterized protein n=1 Tax=Colocasia esculenta TaxID=4460 RepID=A0A843VLY9_COLES|nr:hypothetical protein [Colocasia esculenta]